MLMTKETRRKDFDLKVFFDMLFFYFEKNPDVDLVGEKISEA